MAKIDMEYATHQGFDEDLSTLLGMKEFRDEIKLEDSDTTIDILSWSRSSGAACIMDWGYRVKLEGKGEKVLEYSSKLINKIGIPEYFSPESNFDLVEKLLEPYGKKTKGLFSLMDWRRKVVDKK